MPRDPEPVAGTGHDSGYTGISNEHKYKRELYEVLVNGCNFSSDAAKKVITEGGIEQVDVLVDHEEKECEEVCTAIRKSGTPCAVLSKKNLALLCKVDRFHRDIGCAISWLDVTKDWIYSFEDLFKLQVNYSTPDVTFRKFDKKDLTDPRKVKEEMWACLAQYRNDDGVCMLYTVREFLIPKESETFGHADTIYESLDEELMLRYPILEEEDAFDHTKTPAQVKVLEKNGPFTPIYRRNRTWLYNKVKCWFGDTDLWNHAAGHKASEDGRGALFAIIEFIFGHEYSKSLSTKTIDLMTKMYYSGQSANYDFNMHVTKFAGHVAVLKTLEEEGTYRGMDGDKINDYFMATIKAPFFEASKNTVYDSNAMRNDWTLAAKHMKTYLESDPSYRNSSHTRGGGGRGAGGGGRRAIAEAKSLRGGGGGRRGGDRKKGKFNFTDAELDKAMAKIRQENNLAKDDKNFFIPDPIYIAYTPVEKAAIWRARGGKSRKRGRDAKQDDEASQLTTSSVVSALTTKIDTMADSVARLAQMAIAQGKPRRESISEYEEESNDDESLGLNASDYSDREEELVKKRRKKGKSNRNHLSLLNDYPAMGRQTGGGRRN
eukprot:CAMPEP_0172572778 /NCGR_PEP_ID=MMETSP1067-20121228/135852_1 /TAXON_ID=265564 ORGANISM="Thalassiosira punctigera, Strain Tpunct2005C2" /NCGR_SAMPLE_ID=MMETSP1067 /ASSEMBLY_ACC=CAM_ASM_000444 /LENGTH=601 /DNA_ID=CAMNT_0013365365 /DNA_START=843 /DNA_END=2648 /DNA_ORIENTATION=+